MIYKNIFMSYVSEGLVLKLLQIFSNLEAFEFQPEDKNITNNCRLSINIIKKLSLSEKDEITKEFFHPELLHHIHILNYPKGGELNYHDHSEHEHYSFVLYLDNVGGTEFIIQNKPFFVPSEKCKIVYFPSKIIHRGITNNNVRYVAAGGIIKKIKHEG